MTRRELRLVALLSALALTLTACNLSRRGAETTEDEGPVKYGDESSLQDDEQAAQGGGGGGQGQQGGGSSGGSGGGGSQAGGGAGTGGGTGGTGGSGGSGGQIAINDFGANGTAARGLLRPAPYTEIVVEIDFAPGRDPSLFAMAHLERSLEQVTGKDVAFGGSNPVPPRASDTGDDDIVELAQKRIFRSNAPRAALYIVYLNGDHERAPGPGLRVAGVAVRATVLAIFPDTFRRSLPTDESAEASVLLHEVGHLLAMTEIGYISPRDHRDCAHGNHNRFQDSVMYWRSETSDIVNLVVDGPQRFDANDLADLADLRAGREKVTNSRTGSCV